MCHPFYIIPIFPYINVLNYLRSEDEQTIHCVELVCRSQKYNSLAIIIYSSVSGIIF